jgi:hypothetical protein
VKKLRSKSATPHSLALALFVVMGALPQAACSAREIDRFVSAVEAAKELPAVFGIAGDEARLVAEGFGTIATAARAFRAAPDGKTWRTLVAVFGEVKSGGSWQRLSPQLRERVEAVFRVAQRLLESIEPAPTLSAGGEELPAFPNFRNVDRADLRALERLVRGRH